MEAAGATEAAEVTAVVEPEEPEANVEGLLDGR